MARASKRPDLAAALRGSSDPQTARLPTASSRAATDAALERADERGRVRNHVAAIRGDAALKRRIDLLSLDTGISVQNLLVYGLNRVCAELGLEPIDQAVDAKVGDKLRRK